MNEKQISNSSLWAAFGDALGYITELGDESTFSYRLDGLSNQWGKSSWKRKIGGQYGCRVEFQPGTYSDDTQLRLAVSRAINADGIFQKEAFAKIELPAWRCYALGAGLGSLTASENLVKSGVNWNSNFFHTKNANYYDGGGNGAAMRIQPHIWAASNWQHPNIYLLDVISNSIITHGHARGILGSVFHAICLAMTLANKAPLSQPFWNETIPFIKNIPSMIEKEFLLSSVWLTQWQSDTSLDFSEQTSIVIDEFKTYIKEFTIHKTGTPKERYYSFAKAIGAVGGKERGSAVKTSILASAAALLFKDEDPIDCLKTIASLFDSDTDTIATMTGALIGATLDDEPDFPIQDKEYIKKEAKRLFSIAKGVHTESFIYPSILNWKSPRATLELVQEYEEEFYIDGLSPIKFFGKEYKNNTTIWQWAETPFGQTILAKRRRNNYKTIHEPKYGKYSFIEKSTIREQVPKQEVQSSSDKKIKTSQPSLLGRYVGKDSISQSSISQEILALVRSIAANGFQAKEIGDAYLYIENKYHNYLYISDFFALLYKKQNHYREGGQIFNAKYKM